ncbi:trypsin-like peptidase domain-containing protein [Micromonospora sp. NPDC051925]|uniref:trypsin-like peptidase domain-containing protein n=1 Tax=Micromonospora sp. NPDC051925 TaxID=3364288 RepID=UPI0037C63847
MTEFETDPQRRPAATDAEPSHPSAEPSRVERGESDTTAARGDTTAAPGDAAGPAGEPAGTPSPGSPYAPPSSPYAPPSATPYPQTPHQSGATAGDQAYRPGYPTSAGYPGYPSAGQPPSAGYPQSGYPQSGYPQSGWAPGHSGQHAAGQPGPGNPSVGYSGQYGSTAAGQPGTGYPGQQGATVTGQPSAGYPAQAGSGGPAGPQHPGQPVPPWASGPGPQAGGPGPQAGKVAKFVGAGVAVFALMLGSGVAGGALALAVDGGDRGGITRTYSAAPVISSADLPKIAASVQDSVVSIMTDSGEGSGVILSADGFVLTNNHVVASASGGTVKVVFANGKSAQAKIIGTDPKTDLAVVQTSGVDNLKAAKFGDSDAMQVGDQVLALGSPLGLQGSVTAGILSARDRTIQAGSQSPEQPQDIPQQAPQQGASSISGLLQTDAPINPGNSGGALVNTRGEVIGINTAIATAGQGSTGNIGVGFAIPSNKAKDVAEKLQRGEKISHPSLGVSVNAAEDGGALVASVVAGSAAERAGIQRGDVITKFGDKAINDSNDLVGAVQAGKVGDRVEVTYKRNGAEATATVTLAETS